MNNIVLGFIFILIIFFLISSKPKKKQAEQFANSNIRIMQKKQTQNQLTAHTAKALVITCMDFRLIDDAVYFLNSKGYNNNYDELILAGASLGYNQTKFDSWRKTVDDHIGLAKKLHNIKEIIVIDHMDCGAYRLLYEKPQISKNEEISLHKENFDKFRELIKNTYPELEVSTYLMNLNGKIINLNSKIINQ